MDTQLLDTLIFCAMGSAHSVYLCRWIDKKPVGWRVLKRKIMSWNTTGWLYLDSKIHWRGNHLLNWVNSWNKHWYSIHLQPSKSLQCRPLCGLWTCIKLNIFMEFFSHLRMHSTLSSFLSDNMLPCYKSSNAHFND